MPQGSFPHPDCTAWHISIGTARTRLHGGPRKTVDRRQNKLGDPFVPRNPIREKLERETAIGDPVFLDDHHRAFIESILPHICARGGWTYHVGAAPPPPDNHHFHLLLDAPKAVHGKDIRRWLKRWLTEALNERFGGPPDGREHEGPASRAAQPLSARPSEADGQSAPPRPRPWWVDGGSTRPVKDTRYFMNTFEYDCNQRSTPFAFEMQEDA